MPRCSAIVVTYNSAGAIAECLQALTGQDCEIVVVDNASQDDTVARVNGFATGSPVQLVRISRNLGFAAGVNHGVRAASGEVLLILNPDAIAQPGAIGAMLACICEQNASLVGGALLRQDGQPDRGFAFRRLPTLSSLLCEVLLINQLWPGNPVNRRYRCLDADYSAVQEVEQPAGACLAITRDTWDSLAGMDTQFYPVWFEDVDFCKRLRDAGGKIVYCPAAKFRHSGAHSVGALNFYDKQTFWYTNMLRYAKKHFSGVSVLVLRLGIVKGIFLRWVATFLGEGPAGVRSQDARTAYVNVALRAMGIESRHY